MFTAYLLPGHSFQTFTVYKHGSKISETGRPVKESTIEETDITFLAARVQASQKEIDQWKQNGHPITHKIIEYSAQVKATPRENYLVSDDGRQFYIQGANNPGDMNVTIIYYVEERFDVKKKKICM